ncbi:hypothetical protein AB8616_08955 [Marinomonas sp. RS-M-Aa-14]|uniref:hypothetical protein n=1 Tax=Marinomonas sp. RS-M-Aa-14 TaxID=3241169 RepID=UPI003AB0C599
MHSELAYIRVGGSEADKVEYFTSQKPLSEKQHDGLLLSQTMWNNLHHFCQRHDLALIFTLKYGLFERRKQGRWDATEVIDLLKYSQAHQQQIDICELGNEAQCLLGISWFHLTAKRKKPSERLRYLHSMCATAQPNQ